MLAQVNRLRVGVASPLSMCAPLGRSAQAHAEDMATRNFFSHVTPEGRGPGDRINEAGYVGGWGENIAAGYPDVDAVMSGWIRSPGHYANLVNADFEHVGFGKAASSTSEYGVYWVQNFGSGGRC